MGADGASINPAGGRRRWRSPHSPPRLRWGGVSV